MAVPARTLLRKLVRRARRVSDWQTLGHTVRRRLARGAAPAEAGPALLQKLPEIIEYEGEFGAELVLFLPWCNWLSAAGLLRNRRIRTYRGMRCFYDGLDCLDIIEKTATRHFIPLRQRRLPVADEHGFDGVGRSPFHLFPDLRRKFGALPSVAAAEDPARPVVIVHNKYNSEWDAEPVNHIPLAALDAIFTRLAPNFTVIYVRHGMRALDRAFSGDEFAPLPFEDAALLERHPAVLCFDDLYARHQADGGQQDLNTFKNALYSRTYLFITAQGGGAHHIALFAGSLLIVLHRRGRETELAYGDGYYSFMANPAPTRVICRDEAELLDALPLLDQVAITEDRVMVAPAAAGLLRRFSPWRPDAA